MGLRSMFALCPLWAFLRYQSIIKPSNVIIILQYVARMTLVAHGLCPFIHHPPKIEVYRKEPNGNGYGQEAMLIFQEVFVPYVEGNATFDASFHCLK